MPSPNKRAPKVLPADVKKALKDAVAKAKGQGKVGVELGYSAAVISQVLRDAYLGDVSTLEQRIRGRYMAETVQCPVLGKLARNHCLDNQKRPLAFTNPLRVELYRACKTCINRKEP